MIDEIVRLIGEPKNDDGLPLSYQPDADIDSRDHSIE